MKEAIFIHQTTMDEKVKGREGLLRDVEGSGRFNPVFFRVGIELNSDIHSQVTKWC